MWSAQLAARLVRDHLPSAVVSLERGALNGVPLGSYNDNPLGELTVTHEASGAVVAAVVQAHVTKEHAPGPGLYELIRRLHALARQLGEPPAESAAQSAAQ
jgi:hypothetical protein